MAINYLELYADKLVRVSFKDDAGYEKVATGTIIQEDLIAIVIVTVKKETTLIKKELVGNVRELVERHQNGYNRKNKTSN